MHYCMNDFYIQCNHQIYSSVNVFPRLANLKIFQGHAPDPPRCPGPFDS